MHSKDNFFYNNKYTWRLFVTLTIYWQLGTTTSSLDTFCDHRPPERSSSTPARVLRFDLINTTSRGHQQWQYSIGTDSNSNSTRLCCHLTSLSWVSDTKYWAAHAQLQLQHQVDIVVHNQMHASIIKRKFRIIKHCRRSMKQKL
jgi:hypothetical protein